MVLMGWIPPLIFVMQMQYCTPFWTEKGGEMFVSKLAYAFSSCVGPITNFKMKHAYDRSKIIAWSRNRPGFNKKNVV